MPDGVARTLQGKAADLEAELAQLEAPVVDSGGISFGKRVGEGTSIAVERLSQVAVHGRLRAMLSDVTRAQAKLADGTYGSCDSCRTSIVAERLAALPWATCCVRCAAKG